MSSLAEKMDLTRRRISELAAAHDPERIAVAWTGGKDSTLVLWIWREYLRGSGARQDTPLRALNLDTGLKFPEVLRFRDSLWQDWGVDLIVAKPDVDLVGYPVAEDPLTCCRDLKIQPLNEAVRRMDLQVLLTGVRRDEHPSRAERSWIEEKQSPDYLQAHPILHWTEMDVWSMYMAEDLPYCSLYEQGYRSLGCRPCTQPATGGERSGRESRKEDVLETLRSLGYF